MFDGENCIRCKKHFKFEELIYRSNAWGMCNDCDAKVDASKEPIRRCPHDGTEMQKTIIYECVLIDACPSCKGIWFDGDEIAIVRKMVQLEGLNSSANVIPWLLLPLISSF